MRSVSSAICTSGEPVSPFLVAYCLTTSSLRSELSDIGYRCNCWGQGGGRGRDVVQLRSRAAGRGGRGAARPLAGERVIHEFAALASEIPPPPWRAHVPA